MTDISKTQFQKTLEPIDYLVIGNITLDITPNGLRLGGTAAYASLTAKALGLKVGIITSCSSEIDLTPLKGLQILRHNANQTTTFENIITKNGRVQFLHHRAGMLDEKMVPELWKTAPIVHLGPVAGEVDPNLSNAFPNSLVCVTAQGWLRETDAEGKICFGLSKYLEAGLTNANVVVISFEDLEKEERRLEEFHTNIHGILALTDSKEGVRVFWNGDQRKFCPPDVKEIDAVGAGDIFAAAFFYKIFSTNNPWEAANFATKLSAISVTRPGLEGVPTMSEIERCTIEIIPRV